jgi:hypothetical protein
LQNLAVMARHSPDRALQKAWAATGTGVRAIEALLAVIEAEQGGPAVA